MNHPTNLINVIDNLSEYLEYEAEENNAPVEISPDTLKELGQPCPAASHKQQDDDAGVKMKKTATAISVCKKCSLCKTRTKTVPGQGSLAPEIMFVGEAPGADEDAAGLAFVGRAGQLLTKMINAMGYAREEVFIGNILKCRPPENRKPSPEEMELCLPYLKEQIAVLKPKIIIALGATAIQGLLGISTGITKFRGTWSSFSGIDLMPTYHPAYLLRNPPAKKEVWQDLQAVLTRLGRKPPQAESKKK